MALKSEENEAAGTQKTFISVLDVKNKKELMPETKIGDFKFEGVEFI